MQLYWLPKRLLEVALTMLMNNIVKFCAIIFAVAVYQPLKAQLVTDPNPTAQQVVQDVLLGTGVEAFNITFSGNSDQIGTFDCNNCGIGLNSGVLLSTGSVTVAQGPNNSGSATVGGGNFGVSDPDLDILSTFATNDAAVLEFDFIPIGDSVAFQYVFGSEEYNEYVCGSVNDAFGFFLSGPGINGPFSNNAINLALVPGTNIPVTINTVNLGVSGGNGTPSNCAQVSPNWNQNAEFYVNNENNGSPITVQFDGFTVILTASAQVVCGETYHIKIAIADAGDTAFDSGVFLKESSFTSPQIDVDLSIQDVGANDSTIYEGCGTSFLVFTRSNNIPAAQNFDIQITGNAIPGVDYTALPGTIVFGDNIFEVSIPFGAFADGIPEGLEWVTITYLSLAACVLEEEFQSETFYIMEPDPLEVELDDVIVDCNGSAILDPLLSGGYGLYEFVWETGEDIPLLEVSPGITTTYNYTLSDTCGLAPFEGSVTVEVLEYPALTVELGGTLGIGCLDALEITALPQGGNEVYFYEWTNDLGAIIGLNQTLVYDPDTEGTIYLQVTDECGNVGSDEVDFTFTPEPLIVQLNGPLQLICLGQSLITPEVTGGIGQYFYTWTGINSEYLGDTPTLNYTMGQEGIIALNVIDECGNEGADELVIELIPTPVTVDLGPDIDVTCVDITALSAIVEGGVGNYSYEWIMGGEVQAETPVFDAQTDVSAFVLLNVQDECGNTNSDEILLNIPPIPVFVNLGEDQLVDCQEANILNAEVSGGIGSYTYEWFVDDDLESIDDTLEVQVYEQAIIWLDVIDECGNIGSDTLLLSVPDMPITVVCTPDTLICAGETLDLQTSASGGYGGFTYLWVQLNDDDQEIEVQPLNSITYQVVAEDICGNIGYGSVTVVVEHVYANFDFDYEGNWGIETYNGSAPQNANFVWDFGDGTFSNEFDPEHEYSDFYEHQIILYSTTINGCTDSISRWFYPFMDIYVPNSFSPNNDGINDYFKAEGHDIYEFQLWIFNRWGEKVFYTDNIDIPWIGNHEGGEYYTKTEVYTYRIKARGIRGNSIEKAGTVTLLR